MSCSLTLRHPHRRVGIEADVFFGCRKLNQILLFPVSRHTPGNLLHSVRHCVFDGIMDLTEIWLDIFRLLCNIFFLYSERCQMKAAGIKVLAVFLVINQ